MSRTFQVPVVKAARQLEVTAERVGYWAAHDTHKDTSPDRASAALSLRSVEARKLLARYGCRTPPWASMSVAAALRPRPAAVPATELSGNP